jgi:hypothetical protein
MSFEEFGSAFKLRKKKESSANVSNQDSSSQNRPQPLIDFGVDTMNNFFNKR